MKLKVLFMGTPAFAVETLKMLTEHASVTVCGVVTQPDKQSGRGNKLSAPPVKEFALQNNLEVFQPATLKDGAFLPVLEEKQPDLIVVAAYGKILPAYVLQFPKYGCINVHASLLPQYRGAAPIHWCLINGERETGVTIMQMDAGLDTGDMLLKKTYTILPTDTTGSLFEKLAVIGAQALSAVLTLLAAGTPLHPIKQEESLASYAPMISKEFSYLDWNKPATEIVNLIRGLNPFPGAKTTLNGKLLKILFAETDDTAEGVPGTVVEGERKLRIVCGDGKTVSVKTMQPEGKKPMDITAYLKGHTVETGTVLGK